MDAVARAIARRGPAPRPCSTPATTPRPASRGRRSASTRWTTAFEDLDRYGVAGNHDNGAFVSGYLADLGWTNLDGEPVEGPAARLLGVDDPRSSGLGNWRDETGLSASPRSATGSPTPSATSEERIATLLVHDANLGREALARGCTDLVRRRPPARPARARPVVGENGKVGYTYTNGTTGGAAYAIAVGSKPRRDAGVTLVTYRRTAARSACSRSGSRPTATFVVGDFAPLEYAEPAAG